MEAKFKRGDTVMFLTGGPQIVITESKGGNISGVYYNSITGAFASIMDYTEEFFILKKASELTFFNQ